MQNISRPVEPKDDNDDLQKTHQKRSYRICNIELKCISSQRELCGLCVLITSDQSWNKHNDTITANCESVEHSLSLNKNGHINLFF